MSVIKLPGLHSYGIQPEGGPLIVRYTRDSLNKNRPWRSYSLQLLLFSGFTQQCHFGAFGIGSPFSQA